MPVLIVWLLRGLLGIAPSLIAMVLTRLGVGMVTYTGISALTNTLSTQIFGMFGSIDSFGMQMLGLLQVGTCINIMLSAITVKLTIKGLSGAGSIKKIVMS